MLGGSDNLSNYLVKFNSSEWANQANSQLQQALQQGLQYSEKYTQQALNAVQDYHKQANTQMQQGFNQAQALDAPKHLATYNALDAYQGTLGLPTPVGGSFQLAKGVENSLFGQPNTPQQQQQASGFNQGVLNTLQQGGQ